MTYSKHVDNIRKFLLELLFPSFCLGCRKEGTYLCPDCKATLDISEHQYCLCSKHPLRLPVDSTKGKCQRSQDAPLSGLYTALPYQEKFLTKKLIYQFKYPPYYIKVLARDLAGIIATHLVIIKKNTNSIWEHSVLVPIPMEMRKMKDRGYNQTEELAKELGHLINVPSISGNLVKIKKTLPQMKLSATERQENIKNAFALKNPETLRGKKIFLVDDVYTTGSTMQECARVLRAAGAKQVWGIVIAREG